MNNKSFLLSNFSKRFLIRPHWGQTPRSIHRDMTQNELRDIRKSNSNLADITSKLANGEIRKEDLDEDTVNRLKDVLYN